MAQLHDLEPGEPWPADVLPGDSLVAPGTIAWQISGTPRDNPYRLARAVITVVGLTVTRAEDGGVLRTFTVLSRHGILTVLIAAVGGQ